MAAVVTDDGAALHVEEVGHGEPLVFIHEFAGDHRSWEPQIRFFSAAYHCVTYAARGYPPSDVPTDPAACRRRVLALRIGCRGRQGLSDATAFDR
jgi:pimeloyl-ACP methyl ester carboxylesterase